MKKFITTLFFSLWVIYVIAQNALIGWAGQSNALGYADGPNLPIEYQGDIDRSYSWTINNWQVLNYTDHNNNQNPVRVRNNKHGFQLAFSYNTVNHLKWDTVFNVTYAIGSTYLCDTTGENWYPDSGDLFDSLHTTFMSAYSNLITRGSKVDRVILFWLQGENEAGNPGDCSLAYGENLSMFMDSLFHYITIPNFKVVIIKINIGSIGTPEDVARIRQAEENVAKTNYNKFATFSTDLYPVSSDHFSSSSYNALGLNLAYTFMYKKTYKKPLIY